MATVTVTATHVRALEGSNVRPYEAAEAMNVGDVIYTNSDGKAALANAGATATIGGTAGIVCSGSRANPTGAIIAGETVAVVLHGEIYLGENAALDETKIYYAGSTAGDLVDVAPANRREIGTPISSVVFFVNTNTAPVGSI